MLYSTEGGTERRVGGDLIVTRVYTPCKLPESCTRGRMFYPDTMHVVINALRSSSPSAPDQGLNTDHCLTHTALSRPAAVLLIPAALTNFSFFDYIVNCFLLFVAVDSYFCMNVCCLLVLFSTIILFLFCNFSKRTLFRTSCFFFGCLL